MRKAAAVVVSVIAIALACGGETPAPNNNPQTDAAPTPSATASVDTSPKDAGPPAIEAQHDPFVAVCMQSMPSQVYCACAWDQFRDIFKDADVKQQPSDDKVQLLKQRTQQTCAPKLTDTDVKPMFTNACVGSEPKKQPFCDCEWTELRKKLDAADFIGEFTGAKFDDAKKAMAKACKGKLGDELAKKDLMAACTKAQPGHEKACECMWKKVHAKATAEEIAADVVDTKALGLEACLKTP